jgi:hypothetical protein
MLVKTQDTQQEFPHFCLIYSRPHSFLFSVFCSPKYLEVDIHILQSDIIQGNKGEKIPVCQHSSTLKAESINENSLSVPETVGLFREVLMKDIPTEVFDTEQVYIDTIDLKVN